jgi:hypothetical protein
MMEAVELRYLSLRMVSSAQAQVGPSIMGLSPAQLAKSADCLAANGTTLLPSRATQGRTTFESATTKDLGL